MTDAYHFAGKQVVNRDRDVHRSARSATDTLAISVKLLDDPYFVGLLQVFGCRELAEMDWFTSAVDAGSYR